MTEKDLVKGERYTPISKSTGDPFDKCNEWHSRGGKEQGFLYFKGIHFGRCVLGIDTLPGKGSFYLAEDLIPYVEKSEDEKDIKDHAREIFFKCNDIIKDNDEKGGHDNW